MHVWVKKNTEFGPKWSLKCIRGILRITICLPFAPPLESVAGSLGESIQNMLLAATQNSVVFLPAAVESDGSTATVKLALDPTYGSSFDSADVLDVDACPE